MNARQAIQHLHDRHPQVVDAPVGELLPERLGFEFLCFQFHVCDLIDDRQERAVKRCFETMHQLLEQGDVEVKRTVASDFVEPHLVCHRDLDWAKGRMAPPLAKLCTFMRRRIDRLMPGG